MNDFYDATVDFQTDSNSGIWTYGYSTAGGSAYAFLPFDNNRDNLASIRYGLAWSMSGYNIAGTPTAWRNLSVETQYGVRPGQMSLHPGPAVRGDFAILRFTAPADADYKVVGQFFAGDKGEMNGSVIRGGDFDHPLETFPITSDDSSFRFDRVTLSAGQTLDFVVGNNGDFSFGNTPIAVSIAPLRTGLALSGGGSKGDFEVGALQYLYGRGFRPSIITSTSVGSVNGLKLAEGEGAGDQGLQGLTRLWLGLSNYADFFGEQPWLMQNFGPIRYLRQFVLDFAALNPSTVERTLAVDDACRALLPAEAAALAARRATIDPLGEFAALEALFAVNFALGFVPGAVSVSSTLALAKTLADEVARLQSIGADLVREQSFFNLAPTRDMAAASLDLAKVVRWADEGHQLRMAAVGLRSGELRYVTERGQVLDRRGVPLFLGTTPPAQCQVQFDAVDAIGESLSDLIATVPKTPAMMTRIAALRAQMAEARAALGACVAANPAQPAPVTVGLVDGMIASASMPTFFEPTPMGEDVYVDGGIREVIPVQAALDIGANTTFAISASKMGIDTDPPDKSYNLATVALRSLMDIAINEVAYSDVAPLLADPAHDIRVIQPRVDIHTTFAVYPAFVRNRMAYGYMCAADAFDPPDGKDKAERAQWIADRIAVLRYATARLECWRSEQPVPPAMVRVPLGAGDRDAAEAAIAQIKREISDLVAERGSLGAALPPLDAEWGNAPGWAAGDEVHPWNRGVQSNEASLSLVDVPLSIPSGGTATVHVDAFNAGTSPWLPSGGYRLEFDASVGIGPVTVPVAVPARGSCRFTVTVSAPGAAGMNFCCRMAANGVGPFGDPSDSVHIVAATVGEPAGCANIRSAIQKTQSTIARLTDALSGDPRADVRVRLQIAQANAQLAALRQEGQQMGCSI